MAGREMKSIPKPTNVGKELAAVLHPIIHNIEVRFLRRRNNELTITRQDLLNLGLATQEQLDNLEDN